MQEARENRLAIAMQNSPHSLCDFGPLAGEYDRWYDTPAGRLHDQYQEDLARRFLSPAGTGEQLLDVGCGTGHWSRFFALLGFLVTGIDISPEMIKIARSHEEPGCRFGVADALELPFKDRSFDGVTMMATLEFLPRPDIALEEMARCAKQGGRLLVGTLNPANCLNRHRVEQGKEPYASAEMYSAEKIQALLSVYGQPRVRITGERPMRERLRSCFSLRQGFQFGEMNKTGAFIIAEVRL